MKRTAVIKPCDQRYKDPDRPATEQKICLFTKDGKRLLGRHPDIESAKKQEAAIHAKGGATETSMKRKYIKLAEVPESAVKSLYDEKWGAGIMKALGEDFPLDSKAAQFLFFTVWNAVIQLMDKSLMGQKTDTTELSKDPTFMQSLAGLAYFVADDAIKRSLGIKSDSLQKGAGHAEALMAVLGKEADVNQTLQGLKKQAEPIVEKAFDQVTNYLKTEEPAQKAAKTSRAALFVAHAKGQQHTAGYWYLPEDLLYSVMGIEPGFEYFDEYAMPDGLPTDEASRRAFYEALEDKLGELEGALERVLDTVRYEAKSNIDSYIKQHGADPREAEHELWYRNMADDFAQETLFGLRGGVPEYHEIHLTYLPDMFEWLGIDEDLAFFDMVADNSYGVGAAEWESWVDPTIVEAWDEAKQAVREYLSEIEEDEDYPPDPRQQKLPHTSSKTKLAAGWKKLPKGWTEESVKKFWDGLAGDRKHKVTACIKKMEGKVDDPGAFCASLKDLVEGTEWRHEKRSSADDQHLAVVSPKSADQMIRRWAQGLPKDMSGAASVWLYGLVPEDGTNEDWIVSAEHEGLYIPPAKREIPYVKEFLRDELNDQLAGQLNNEADAGRVGSFFYDEQNGQFGLLYETDAVERVISLFGEVPKKAACKKSPKRDRDSRAPSVQLTQEVGKLPKEPVVRRPQKKEEKGSLLQRGLKWLDKKSHEASTKDARSRWGRLREADAKRLDTRKTSGYATKQQESKMSTRKGCGCREAAQRHYAVAQLGHVIHGIGSSCAEAIVDTNSYMTSKADWISEADLVSYHNAMYGDLVCLPCSEELYHLVDREGGDVPFEVSYGELMTADEAYEFEHEN